jgi:hypothetical protein
LANNQRDHQNINLRTGENERISVGLEQGEKEMALVKPGEKINKGMANIAALTTLSRLSQRDQRVAKQLTG